MKKILVIGASGFVGRHIAAQLLAEGYAVRCLDRNQSKPKTLGFAALGYEVVHGDITDLTSMQNAVKSVDAVYIAVQTLSTQPARTTAKHFMDTEFTGLQNIITACKTHNVKRIIFITFMGANADALTQLARDRFTSEEILLNSGLDVTIIRPGMIVGVGGQGYDMVVSNAKKSLAVVMGSGQNTFQCIAVTDLAYYLVGVLNKPATYGQRYDVGGDEIVTIPEMIDSVAQLIGRSNPKKVHVPLSMLRVIAPFAEPLMKLPKGAMKAIVDGLGTNLTGDTTPIRKVLPRPLLDFQQASKKALLLA